MEFLLLSTLLYHQVAVVGLWSMDSAIISAILGFKTCNAKDYALRRMLHVNDPTEEVG